MNSDWVIRNVMYNSLHYTTVYRLLNAYHIFDFQITSWEHNCIGWRSNRQHECKWTRNGYRNHERKRMNTQVYCLQSEFSKNLFFSKKQIAYYTVCSKHIGKTYLLCYYSNTSSSNVAVPAKQRQIMISQVVSHGRCHRRRLIRLTDNILTITFSVPFPRPIYRYWTAYKPLIELFEIQYMYPEFRLH